MSRKVLNWFKNKYERMENWFGRANLNRVNTKSISKLIVEGYSPELAKIRVEYFNYHAFRMGYPSDVDDDIYFSKAFSIPKRLMLLFFFLTCLTGMVFIVEILMNIEKFQKNYMIAFLIIFGVFFVFAIITMIVRKKIKRKNNEILNLEMILHYNHIDSIEDLNLYIDEMENILKRPHAQREWFNGGTYFWVFFIPILSIFLATTPNDKLKSFISGLLGRILVAMLLIWVFRMFMRKDIPKLFRQKQIKSNIFLSELYSIQHKWQKKTRWR